MTASELVVGEQYATKEKLSVGQPGRRFYGIGAWTRRVRVTKAPVTGSPSQDSKEGARRMYAEVELLDEESGDVVSARKTRVMLTLIHEEWDIYERRERQKQHEAMMAEQRKAHARQRLGAFRDMLKDSFSMEAQVRVDANGRSPEVAFSLADAELLLSFARRGKNLPAVRMVNGEPFCYEEPS